MQNRVCVLFVAYQLMSVCLSVSLPLPISCRHAVGAGHGGS